MLKHREGEREGRREGGREGGRERTYRSTGLSPFLLTSVTSAPFCSSSPTTPASPKLAAKCNGVFNRMISVAFTFTLSNPPPSRPPSFPPSLGISSSSIKRAPAGKLNSRHVISPV
jgi:hypothetical protein